MLLHFMKISNVLGDGVFDKLSNQEIIRAIWDTEEYNKDYHKFTGNALDNVMREVFMSKSTDNISAIIITFDGFLKFYNQGLTSSNFFNYFLILIGVNHRSKLDILKTIEEIEFIPDNSESIYDGLDNDINLIDKNKLSKLP